MPMFVGSCQIQLRLMQCRSLKEKRFIVKSLKDRIIQRFKVSAAEVDDHDLWQKTSLGVAIVSANKIIIEQTLSKIMNLIEQDGRTELIDYYKEIV